MTTPPLMPLDQEPKMIRISERKLLWVIIAVLAALLALEGVALINQNDRISRMEKRVRHARGTETTLSASDDETMSARRDRSKSKSGGGRAKSGKAKGGKTSTGWARDSVKASQAEGGDGTAPPQRESPVTERLEAFIVANSVGEEDATALRSLLEQTQTEVQAVRQQSVAGELTSEQRKEAIQQAFERCQAQAGDIVGPDLAQSIATDVFSTRRRGDGEGEGEPGGQPEVGGSE